jgi:diguanylate cyclase (GGDEF)-like protein
MASESWRASIAEIGNRFQKRLLSLSDFGSAIDKLLCSSDCPVEALTLTFNRKVPHREIKVGTLISGRTPDRQTENLDDGTEMILEAWASEPRDAVEIRAFTAAFTDLMGASWKSPLRDFTGMVVRTTGDAPQLINNTIVGMLKNARVAVVFADLDHFKQINETVGHERADAAVCQFAPIIERMAGSSGVAFHRSGDEFGLLIPIQTATEALRVAREFSRDIASTEFDTKGLQVTAKMGIAIIDQDELQPTYEKFELFAERATKNSDGESYRGKVRFHGSAVESLPQIDSASTALALCNIKTGAALIAPFASPWINLISTEVYHHLINNSSLETLGETVDRLVAWIEPTFDESVIVASLTQDAHLEVPIFSHLDTAFAMAHGLLRSLRSQPLRRLTVEYGAHTADVRLRLDEQIVYDSGVSASFSDTISIGISIGVEGTISDCRISPMVLLKVGHDDLEIPEKFFADVIVIDDRPTKGGGLPDFWEAAIARLVERLENDRNVSFAFVIGNHDHAEKTIARLRVIESWKDDLQTLARKTAMKPESIEAVASRLRDGIRYPSNRESLLQEMVTVLRERHEYAETTRVENDEGPEYVLKRNVDLQDFTLLPSDGCRVDTIFQAYPLVLEIVRKETVEGVGVDQAHQRLHELIDFKVSLRTPTLGMIPAFYKTEEASLTEYFQSEFLERDGKFQAPLADQIEPVVEHLVDIISGDPAKRFDTRRAVLVVPHRIERPLVPLGLISVRIIPRFKGPRTILHYSYTWRTVEACVGFPYSLYGSVRFSQHLTTMIQDRLAPEQRRNVEMGEVHYVAHSLHFFLDTYARGIARVIVNEATE